MKAAAQKDEEDLFGLALADPICHGAHHSFDGILHVPKAKTSKNKGEEEWKNLLRDRLENDYHGFQHAFKTAHDLMNAGLLPDVAPFHFLNDLFVFVGIWPLLFEQFEPLGTLFGDLLTDAPKRMTLRFQFPTPRGVFPLQGIKSGGDIL